MTRPTAIYLRISDPKGDTADRFGLAVQERASREYAERVGLTIQRVYSDAITGTTEQRVGFGQLLADAPAYTDVVVYAVDRLARHPRAGYALLETLQAAGLQVHTATEGMLDLEDDAGALNFGIRIIMADSDRRKITRRLSEGKKQKVRNGSPLKPLNGYGFKNGEIYEPEAQWIRHMYRKSLEFGTHELREELHQMGVLSPTGKPYWDRDSLRKLLRNPTYRGEYVYGNDRTGRRRLPDAVTCRVPQIVSDELWHAAQRAAEYRSTGAGRRGTRRDAWPLTGRIRCGECGGAMVGHLSRRSGSVAYYYYKCGDRALSPHTRKGCTHFKNYPADEMHQVVREALTALKQNDAALRAAIAQPAPRPLDTSVSVRDIDQQLSKARNAYLRGIDSEDEYAETKVALTAQRAKLISLGEQGVVQPVIDLVSAQAKLAQALAQTDIYQTATELGMIVRVSATGAVKLALDPT